MLGYFVRRSIAIHDGLHTLYFPSADSRCGFLPGIRSVEANYFNDHCHCLIALLQCCGLIGEL